MSVLTASTTASLTGRYALQGQQAAAGMRWWAATDGVSLQIVDDRGEPPATAYRSFLDEAPDLILGPYGSGQVRAAAPVVTGAGALLWNHGGSADDLARPLLVSLPAPASTYFHDAVAIAAAEGLEEIVVARGGGSFARLVTSGAAAAAAAGGMPSREVDLRDRDALVSAARPGTAVLIAGAFEDDVAAVRALADRRPGFMGCVAAGLAEFGERLGEAAEGVVGPVQWWPGSVQPEVGPSGAEFSAAFRARFGVEPGYVAAQAAAAGFLAAEARRRGHGPDDVRAWRSSTLLGDFSLDGAWQQVGHTAKTIRWHGAHQVLVDPR